MPYVMVPVPEEHAIDVMEFIVRQVVRASVEPWDRDSFTELFLGLDEASRSVLSVVARGVLGGKQVVDAVAAKSIQLGVREMLGIVRELADRTRESNRPTLITILQTSEALPNGRVREKRVMSMAEPVAALVRDTERAEVENNPHPLRTDAG